MNLSNNGEHGDCGNERRDRPMTRYCMLLSHDGPKWKFNNSIIETKCVFIVARSRAPPNRIARRVSFSLLPSQHAPSRANKDQIALMTIVCNS